ncbi:hypothetical protein BGZ72_007529 [Mortierella alpina]|nr:hypothetical protein BGZ72_007529 [Mortierella alpina]
MSPVSVTHPPIRRWGNTKSHAVGEHPMVSIAPHKSRETLAGYNTKWGVPYEDGGDVKVCFAFVGILELATAARKLPGLTKKLGFQAYVAEDDEGE